MPRPVHSAALTLALVALAGSTTALAVHPAALDSTAGDDHSPAALARAFGLPAGALARPHAANALDLSGAWGAVTRGGAGADVALSTMDTGFETLAPLPASLVNQLDTVQWGGASASVTGRSHFSTATAPLVPPHFGAVSDAVGGNTTQTLRALVSPAFGPSAFFGRWARYNFYRANTASPTQQGAERFVFRPDTGQDVRIVHDTFVNAVTSSWTCEPTSVSSGFIVGRLLWGGLNATTGFGLPVGPIPYFYSLSEPCGPIPCPPYGGVATPDLYRGGEPFPGGAGQPVPLPVGSWFRIIAETTVSGALRFVIDRLDGHGEFVIFEGDAIGSGRVDRMAWAGGFETAGDACYIDNLHVQGIQHLTCLRPQGDVNFDGVIDFADLNTVLSQFGQTGTGLIGDVNNDGVVNFADLNIVLSNYGAAC